MAQRELQNEIERLKQSENVADVEVAFDQVIKQNKSDISHLKSQIDQLKSQMDENTDSTLHDSVHQITCDFESFIRYEKNRKNFLKVFLKFFFFEFFENFLDFFLAPDHWMKVS